MKNYRVLPLLASLDDAMLARLRAFLSTDFYNSNQKILNLFEILCRFYPNFDEDIIENEVRASKILGEGFDENRLIKLYSKLFALAEKFLIHDSVDSQKPDSLFYLLQFYRRQNLLPHYQSVWKELSQQLDKNPAPIGNYYWYQYRKEQELTEYQSIRLDTRTEDVNFQNESDAFDTFFIITKLKLACQMLNRNRTAKYNYKYNFVTAIETHIVENVHLQSIKEISLWHKSYQLLNKQGTLSDYKELKELLAELQDKISSEDLRIIFTYLENLAADIFDKDNQDYYIELFTLYNKQLEIGCAFIDNYLLNAFINNYITVSLNLNKPQEALNFLEFARPKMLPSPIVSEDNFQFCLAKIFFYQTKFLDVLDCLNRISERDLYTRLGEKRIRLKTYFELQYHELFKSLVTSFRKFLVMNQNSIPEKHLEAHRNFINLTNKLFDLRNSYRPNTSKILLAINSEMLIPEKQWLIDALRKMSNGG